jgi:hypothetical protein
VIAAGSLANVRQIRRRRPGFRAEAADRIELQASVSYEDHAEILQVFGSQLRQYLAGDIIPAERRFVALKAKLPEPIADIHRASSPQPHA